MDTQEQRSLAMSAGHLTLAVSKELGRLLVANGGNRRKALAAGFDELTTRKALQPKEATELAAIMEMFFDTPGGNDPKLIHRAKTYFDVLTLDPSSSSTALAIASVISSLTSSTKAAAGAGSPQTEVAAAVTTGDGVFGGFGAVVGAGIGFGFGGPIGAGIGAVVGAAVGVCIERG